MISGIQKKRRGGTRVVSAAFILTSLVAVTVFLLFMMSSHYKSLNSLSEVNMILRTYLLRTETKGYLSAGEVAALMQELEECGVTNIRLSGNFAADVTSNIRRNYGKSSFGEEVLLRIEGDFSITVPEKSENNFFSMQQSSRHIDIVKRGVASQ